ncbi:hypothetical protein MIR68_000959 [Amoeboaphelidium protococcarum]|nr:hypothetical protein MIR68_000959 [Amoeboaphelidium protococcarum]
MVKFICVCGGVISGIGKGVIASSTGLLLKSFGLKVTALKIDPYLNIDAGLMSPFDHGEVYVLDDGSEVDLDLGNYERFLDVQLTAQNNLTTGKVYRNVIEKERRGDYLGKTVQVVPHITDEIQNWIETVGKGYDVCIVELGGTVGDIESAPFIEALRQFQFRVGAENFCLIMVSLVPQVGSSQEQKSKPTQASVRDLRGLGLSPDVIACRSERQLEAMVREKISMFCHVGTGQVIGVHDCESVWHVPHLLKQQGLVEVLSSKLRLQLDHEQLNHGFYASWKQLTAAYDRMYEEVNIVLVGKYTHLQDSYTSVVKSLKHAAMACDRKLVLNWIEASDLEDQMKLDDPLKYHAAWKLLCSCEGVIVPGGFGGRGTEGKIIACKYARENRIPFLGICLGLQLAVIEFARNVCGITGAHSEEFPSVSAASTQTKSADDASPISADKTASDAVVVFMPEVSKDQMGGTMRLGSRTTHFKPYPANGGGGVTSTIQKLYGGVSEVHERHRHRYEVNPKLVDQFEQKGMYFVGRDDTGCRMEIFELRSQFQVDDVVNTDASAATGMSEQEQLPSHPYYVGVQFHPEYLSRPLRPSAPFMGLILAASKQLGSHLQKLKMN